MGILDVALGLVNNQVEKIAKVTGKSPKEIRGAIAKGKELLPKIMADPSPAGGAKLLNDLGVEKSFINGALNKYGKFASKLGLNEGAVKNAVDVIGAEMDRGRSTRSGSNGFDKSKYPTLK